MLFSYNLHGETKSTEFCVTASSGMNLLRNPLVCSLEILPETPVSLSLHFSLYVIAHFSEFLHVCGIQHFSLTVHNWQK